MQTLGVSDTTPQTENRFKSLFWPSVQNATDIDYLGRQGFWVAALLAIVTGFFLCVVGNVVWGFLMALTFFLGALGIRQRDLFSAVVLFLIYALDTLLKANVLRICLSAVLLSNVRAVWISGNWARGSEQAELPPRLNELWSDKLSDQLPQKLWPKVRWLSYILSSLVLLLTIVGALWMLGRRGPRLIF